MLNSQGRKTLLKKVPFLQNPGFPKSHNFGYKLFHA